ncbi:glycosyltransferase [Nautilia sp.]
MRVSGFTFLRNGSILGYPFRESIISVLPIVDEFIVALGPCEDDTEEILKSIKSDKIKIIKTQWNENMKEKGFVYGQQKMIAQFNCTGDWAFYLEADEVVHEDDLDNILKSMEKYKNDDEVEALYFDYIHFYGNKNTYLDSPGWYRREVRIIKNSIRTIAPDGLFWWVLDGGKCARYPKAAFANARIYHYGWVRNEEQMNLKLRKVTKYWKHKFEPVDYSEIDASILREFKGTHPKAVLSWLPEAEGTFEPNAGHILTKREKRHRVKAFIEKILGLDLSKKHFKRVK